MFLTRLDAAGTRLELAGPDGAVPQWIVVVGRNGSGKSALLSSLALRLQAEHPARVRLAHGFQRLALSPAFFDRTDLPEGFLDGLDRFEDPRVAGLLFDVWAKLSRGPAGAPALVLIDGIESGLHISWQRRIKDLYLSRFPDAQFVVTTHSPYICQGADPGGLIRLPGPREQRPPEVVEPELHRRVVYGSADDAALSDLFGLESAYSAQAERLRAELVALERRILRGQADPAEEERHRELALLLASSPAARADELARRRHRGGERGRRGEP